MSELETGSNQSEIRYLQPLKIDTGNRQKYDRFLRYGLKYVDYKDTKFLLQFVNEQGKILPRRLTGNSAKYQRKVAQAVKKARHLALLPFVTDGLK